MYRKSNRASEERRRQKLETQLISERFPGVTSIVVKLLYRNNRAPSLRRTLNFRPGSHAFFQMTCLGEGCVDGGLNLTAVVTSMIRNHQESAKGSLHCTGSSAIHADMSYKVSITYS